MYDSVEAVINVIPHALATKQPRLKSDGLQSVVSNARESVQRADQGRRRTALVYRDNLGRTGSATVSSGRTHVNC